MSDFSLSMKAPALASRAHDPQVKKIITIFYQGDKK
jgi:hypothetical protein